MNRRLPVILVAAALVVGCAPTYKKLPTLDRVPEKPGVVRKRHDMRMLLGAAAILEVKAQRIGTVVFDADQFAVSVDQTAIVTWYMSVSSACGVIPICVLSHHAISGM